VTAADDDRLVAQAGVVALLDAGIEGVAVDVGDAEGGKLGMGDQAGRSAGRAAGRPGRGLTRAAAVSAQGRKQGHAADFLPKSWPPPMPIRSDWLRLPAATVGLDPENPN
jgi:hypothetical protein